MNDFLILHKSVDKSVLFEGMSIPKCFQALFYEKIGFTLKKGESRNITVLLDGVEYQAKLNNYDYDEKKYPDHAPVLQIRYASSSELAKKLRDTFTFSNQIVKEFYAKKTDADKHNLKMAEEDKEYLDIYATPVPGSIMFDLETNQEYKEELNQLKTIDERQFESDLILEDSKATIVTKYGLKKIRRVTNAIGNSLKELYGYRCQICGQWIGERYDSNLVHAHHIDYFTKSLNNDSNNILIVCPNHHGIIHDKNPQFDRKTLTYSYPNGYKEGLLVNKHL